MSLFRKEVFENKRPRLYGDVLLPRELRLSFFIGILSLLFIFIISILFFGNFSQSEFVSGHLVSDKGVIKIYPNQSGVISEIHIKNQEYVKQGSSLLVFAIDTANASGVSSEKLSVAIIEKQIQFLDNSLLIENENKDIYLKEIIEEEQEAKKTFTSLNRQIDLQKVIVGLNEKSYQDAELLNKKKILSQIETEKRRQVLLSSQMVLENLKQNIAVTKTKLSLYSVRRDKVLLALKNIINDTEARKLSLLQQKVSFEGNQAKTIQAPISGTVSNILAKVGSVVTPNRPLLTISPSNDKLRVELFAPSRAIGSINVGQEVKVMFDAFPYQQYGLFNARIIVVGDSILLPEDLDASSNRNEPVYRLIAELDKETISVGGRELKFRSGMTLSANIVLDTMPLWQWFVRPILAPLKSMGAKV